MEKLSKQTGMKIVLICILFVLIIALFIFASVPPVSRDALIHHLAIPKLYLDSGKIYEIPSSEFSYYPMNLELLYILPLYFQNDIFAKYIHYIFGLLTTLLIYRYLKKRIGTNYALFGALLFLSIPVIVKLSITAYVDLGLIFFSTVAVLSLLSWIEHAYRIKYLIIASVGCGLALGTKYNGLIVFFLLTLFVPLIYLKSHRLKSGENMPETTGIGFDNEIDNKKLLLRTLGYTVIFFFISLLLFSPWMIRNSIWTGNPVYPLFNNFFNASDAGIADSSTQIGHFGWRAVLFNESWLEIALIPIRIFFQGQDDSPKYFDGQLNPFLILLPFCAFLVDSRNHKRFPLQQFEVRVLMAYAVLFLFFVYAQIDMRIRYVAPIIPPLIIVSTIGIFKLNTLVFERLSNKSMRLFQGLLILGIVIMLGINIAYIYRQFLLVDPASYISGRIDRDSYIEKHRPAYAAIKYANHNIPSNSKILCFFLRGRRYYSDRQMLFDESIFFESIQSSAELETVVADLSKKGITHFLIRYDLFQRWSENNQNSKQRKRLNSFSKNNLMLLFSKGGYGLYGLKKK